jgi:ubiquinone biosynthesis protein UbiJ
MNHFIVNLLQKALNSYLLLDSESAARLQKLTGKIITLELLGLDTTFQLAFTHKEVELTMNSLLPADTTIKGTPLRLLHLALSKERKQFFADDVSIEGNIELGQKVIDLFDQLEIEWEEYAAHIIGDVSAHHLGRIQRGMKSWCQKTRAILLQDVNEYIHEEINLSPPSEALQDFFHDVDNLRMDADRLELKIQLLEKMLINNRGIE